MLVDEVSTKLPQYVYSSSHFILSYSSTHIFFFLLHSDYWNNISYSD